MQFAYDANGLRARKTATSGAVTNYILDGLQALLEKDGTGVTQVRYVPGLARIAGGAVIYYLEDRLGSVVGLTDANQNVTDTFRYDAWGNLLQQQGSTSTPYQCVGQHGYYLNPDAGPYLLGMRHYTAGMGRFLTRDLLGFSGGLNLYTYAVNNPVNLIDPTGLRHWWFGAGYLCINAGCNIPPGTILIKPEDTTTPVAPAGGGEQCVAADALYTAKGVLKIPDNCNCYINCNANGMPTCVKCYCTGTTVMGTVPGFPTPTFYPPGAPNPFGNNPLAPQPEPLDPKA